MKKLLPFFALIILGSCNSHNRKVSVTETSSENKQWRTIHKFVKYLKNKDIKSAQAMLPVQDTNSDQCKTEIYYNEEISSIDTASVLLQQNDIADDSLWVSDTAFNDGDIYLFFVGPWKKDVGNPHPESALCFLFLLTNSDTLFDAFVYKHADLSGPKKVGINGPMQLVHRFTGYLKNNDFKSAKAMFKINDTKTTSHRQFINYEMIQMNHARKALQQSEMKADSEWHVSTDTKDGVQYLFVFGMTKKAIDEPGQPSFRFLFYVDKSDTLLYWFDYGLLHPIL